MKNGILTLTTLITLSFSAQAETAHYQFTYITPQKQEWVLPVQSNEQDFELSFEQAASACVKHFRSKGSLTEDQKLDLVDTCANPKIKRVAM